MVKDTVIEKIAKRAAVIVIIGLGYVGLPLAAEFARKGFRVIGLDIDETRVAQLNDGQSYIEDVPSETLQSLLESGRFRATTDYDVLKDADVVIICVPTPVRPNGANGWKEPDLSCVVAACDEIAQRLHRGQLISLESTTWPGTTEKVLLPRLEANGLRDGQDFLLGFSPERIDPGNHQWTLPQIPKVVSGVTEGCLQGMVTLYSAVFDTVVPVSSTRVAEFTKLLENIFRLVNIALADEMALIASRMGIPICEAIEAAATKPYGFLRFSPGPGIGGHCIRVDPWYLVCKAREYGAELGLVEQALALTERMPEYVVQRTREELHRRGKRLRGARVLILGAAYKPNVSDCREAPALRIIEGLMRRGAIVSLSDPHVPSVRLETGGTLPSEPLSADLLRAADCVILVTPHEAFDYDLVDEQAPLVIDTQGRLRDFRNERVVSVWDRRPAQTVHPVQPCPRNRRAQWVHSHRTERLAA
jgi:UDP-N-acetyl-D-glucosamine dehydrogenase